MPSTKIFISHRSIDSVVANIIKEFLVEIGVGNDDIFCSSLPGYDVKFTIGNEVYKAISQSRIDIIIYSADYYESAYCRNEEGIIWYKNKQNPDSKIIPIVLPEINKDNLLGFIDSQHILRKLDSKTDIATMIDVVSDVLTIKLPSQTIIQTIIEKVIANYSDHISYRPKKTVFVPSELLQQIRMPNARAVLCYLIETKRTDFSVQNVESWLVNNEYYDIDVPDGFKLLSEMKCGTINNSRFVIDLEFFNNLCKHSEQLQSVLNKSLASNRSFSRDTFISMWNLGEFSELQKLFVAFLMDTKLSVLDERLKKRIAEWESDYGIHSDLQKIEFLNLFIERRLITSSKSNNSLVISKSFYEYLHNNFDDCTILEKVKEANKLKHIIAENHRRD